MKRGLMLLVFIFILINVFNFVLAYDGYGNYGYSNLGGLGGLPSISELAQNEWVNAALIFLLVFAVCWFVLQQIFKTSKGAAFIVSIVLGIMGSFGLIYFYGPILARFSNWIIILIIITIIVLLLFQLRKFGIGYFFVLLALALIWLLWAHRQFCPPYGALLPQEVCTLLDTIAMALIIIAIIKLLIWLLNKLKNKIVISGGGGKKIAPEKRLLRIHVQGNGTTNPGPGDHIYKLNQRVRVIARASKDSKFERWILDDHGAGAIGNPVLDIIMNDDHYLIAVFSGEEKREEREERKEEKREEREERKEEKREEKEKREERKEKRSASDLQHIYDDFKFKIFNRRYNESNRRWMLKAMRIIVEKLKKMGYNIKGPSPDEIEAKLKEMKLI